LTKELTFRCSAFSALRRHLPQRQLIVQRTEDPAPRFRACVYTQAAASNPARPRSTLSDALSNEPAGESLLQTLALYLLKTLSRDYERVPHPLFNRDKTKETVISRCN
jgi:hypothetical protein